MEIIDAQIHLWEAESSNRPWPSYGRSYAHGDELTAEQALTTMDEAGVAKAILVPPSWEGDRNDYCLQAARDYPDRFRVMGRFPIEKDRAIDQLSNWRDQEGMLGIRLTFHNEFQRIWLEDGTADPFWGAAEELRLPVMIFVPHSIPIVHGIAERYPGLRLIIDHLGLFGVQNKELMEAINPTLELAIHPNIAVKASCMPSLVSEPFPFPTLQPMIQRIVEAFGPRRTFWGSDVTRLPCQLSENVRLFTEECSFLNEEELKLVMGQGISEFLNW